jgi:hypothetical protein
MYDVFLMSLVLMAGTLLLILALKAFRDAPFFQTKVNHVPTS